MNEHHDVAERVLLDAFDAIRERHKEHGHTERSFSMIGEMWSAYITHAFTLRGDNKLKPQDVAQMMVILKIARSVYGYSMDNFTDGAGYTSLAAVLTPPPKVTVNTQAQGMAGISVTQNTLNGGKNAVI